MIITLVAHAMAHGGRGTSEEHAERMAWILREILPLSGRDLAAGDDLCSAVRVNIEELSVDSDKLKIDDLFRLAARSSGVVFLRFATSIEVNESVAREGMWLREEAWPRQFESIARGRMTEAIATLSLALAIASATEIVLDLIAFESPTDDDHADHSWGTLGRGEYIAREIGWPPLRRIKLADTLEWLQSLPGWARGVSQGRVARAAAAMSHALTAQGNADSALSLVWAMIGLEALYCREREGLRAQLIKNAQLFLGRREAHKTRFGKVYDFRSAFLHGGLEIPYAHRARRSDHDAWRFIWDVDEEAGLAMATLMASLQELVLRRWRELAFETVIVHGPDVERKRVPGAS